LKVRLTPLYFVPTFITTQRPDEELEIEGIKIYASPISLKNNGWSVNTAFQLERNGDNVKDKYEALLKKYPKEGDIDILITHGPPHGFRDRYGSPYKIIATYLFNVFI